MMKRRILAIHAHPDDIEIMAGGTLALLAERGHSITMVHLAVGDCGTAEHSPEEIASIRRKEAAAAAALIGAQHRCAEFRDLAIMNDLPSRRRVTGILRWARPDIVLAAPPVDYMCDHEAASALVRDACFGASAPNFFSDWVEEAPPLPAIPHLYYMDPVDGVDWDQQPILPHFVVNVTSVFEKKKEMLAQHASQRNWLLKQHGMDDYMNTMEEWTRARGKLAGFEFGEGFRLYRGHPYPTTPLLEELLGPELIFRL